MLRTSNATSPLFATIFQTHDLASIKLPLTITDSNTNLRYFDASRTLCIRTDHFDEDEKHFDIRIITSSVPMVLFELRVMKWDAMNIR